MRLRLIDVSIYRHFPRICPGTSPRLFLFPRANADDAREAKRKKNFFKKKRSISRPSTKTGAHGFAKGKIATGDSLNSRGGLIVVFVKGGLRVHWMELKQETLSDFLQEEIGI